MFVSESVKEIAIFKWREREKREGLNFNKFNLQARSPDEDKKATIGKKNVSIRLLLICASRSCIIRAYISTITIGPWVKSTRKYHRTEWNGRERNGTEQNRAKPKKTAQCITEKMSHDTTKYN